MTDERRGLVTWLNRPPWGNDPTPLDVALDVGLAILIATILLLC